MHSHPLQRIHAQAAVQYGVFHRSQAADLGFTLGAIETRVSSRVWDPVLPNVHRIPGSPETWHQALMAGCLWGGARAVASHHSAARLWGLDGFENDPAVEVTVPYGNFDHADGVLVHRTRRLDDRDRASRDNIPVTGIERTLVDLAAALAKNNLEIALECAFRRRLTSLTRVWRRTEDLTGRRGLGNLRRLLAQRQAAPAHSVWEVKLLQLLRDAGLPEPVRQFKVWDGVKHRKIDLAYPGVLIALEYDSHTHHSGRQDWERDHTRNVRLIALGWRVLPITMDDIELRPRETVARIRELLTLVGVLG